MKKASSGFTLVELLVVIGILGILMGALFPAISSAMLSANTAAMSMNGRNLFTGIIQANVDREAHGRESVWPKTSASSDGSEDIASKSFGDADSYFDELFNMLQYGQQDWNPYVNVDLKFLSGSGVPAYKGGTSLAGCVAWTVAANITDEMPDVIPVLVTRNLDSSKLIVSDQATVGQNRESLVAQPKFALPFGNKAAVIIHKGGAAGVYKGRYVTLEDIYEKQTIAFATGADQEALKYLEPTKAK